MNRKNIHIPPIVYLGFVAVLLLIGCSPKLRMTGGEIRVRGNASYYGGKFHGRTTASGERFNQNAMTAAHRTLPFGTKVKVKNLNNGKQVVVRINDRGPSSKSRMIDLSKGAAKKIGVIQAGVVPVEIHYHNGAAAGKKIKTRKRRK
ncbi:septal ring lytic transglycosylase RlpA family protein [Sphingobacterium phlebotomi]|uniref:Probable endolytic peptidoglycan transglycosylase RlpA n=1 Tax=Sphingobacterium phlebotomi TaxID=2605433 RepID=A0A5D4HCK0_9SPHI|nr:septal ring lytic transglycosylase RlpA family protein [Sphingobacterium phlebotomi]TYR38398.1 septal ring lytic transglycosylase RlpA family protein [Sphingobacterium phlebotomi]